MYDGKRVLIIDQLNLFFRNYIVNPSLSINGAPIGGLKGCFQSIQKVCRESKPDVIFICWDGPGGSKKRSLLKKDYKSGRKPIRLNRNVRNLSNEQESENKFWQQARVVEYYNHVPVIQFMFDSTEADDIIAYLAQCKELENAEKIIFSSDKDFFQLLGSKTVQYRPVQKEVLPFLRESKPATFDDIISHSSEMMKESKIAAYQKVLENEDLLKRNYRMMQLYSPMLDIKSKKLVRETLGAPDMSFNKTELIKMMMKDGFGEINFIELFQHFNRIAIDNR